MSAFMLVAAFAVSSVKGAVPRSMDPALFNVRIPAAPPAIIASTSTPDKFTDVADTLFDIVTVPTEVKS